MLDTNEPKDSFDKHYDAIVGGATGGEQQEASSPQTEQTEVKVGSTGEVQKTQDQPQQPETDKGFANHPAWQAREEKLKEARAQLQAKEAEAKRYATLLDEFQKRQTPAEGSQATKLSLAEQACKLKGWDINRLTPEQRDVVNDQVELITAVLEIQRKSEMSELDKRLAPLEQARQRYEQEQAMTKAESKWSELAAEDKLDTKVVQAAINKFCQELDVRDPERTIKLSDEDLYYRATRPLLREKEVSQARQEVRNGVKANARPLGKMPSTPIKDGQKSIKKDESAYLDELLEKNGVRN